MKRVISWISMAAIVMLLMGLTVSAVTPPNKSWLDYEVFPISPIGKIQIQPSHVEEENKHVMQGKVRLLIQLENGNIEYTSYSSTPLATSTSDSTIYQASKGEIILLTSRAYHQGVYYWSPGEYWQTGFEELE